MRALGLLSADALREPLRQVLGARSARKLPLGATQPAAVLAPLFERAGEVHVWLVRRPRSMRSHAGQVALPGGKSDASDASPMATALREAQEELGIAPADVDILGPLDDINTITGFTVSPWVGWVRSDVDIVPNPNEVERAFAAPLRAFFAEQTGTWPRHGWTVDGELVWGATAAIIRDFVAILRGLDARP
jgi:8-oxo-dGTP pyrophosphatase MutT (NUDIX family)